MMPCQRSCGLSPLAFASLRAFSRRARPLAAALLLASACARGPDLEAVWIAPKLAGVISHAHGAQLASRDIFRSDGLSVRLHETLDPEEVRRLIGKRAAFMVRAPQATELEARLRQDPSLLAYFPAAEGGVSHALVTVDDPLALDELAAAAHAAGNHACGALARVDFSLLADTETTHVPAAYSENVKLPAVSSLLAQPQKARIGETISVLEAMGTRRHSSPTGLQATQKVQELFEQALAGKLADVTYAQESHSDADVGREPTAQKSLIVSFPGASDDSTTVILGAHLDSINKSGTSAPAPGADDDASGIATLVEVARVMADSGARFARRVELHAYAAEEIGLVGSDSLAKRYRASGRKVAAMLQIDMNAYAANANAQTIHLVINDTSASLRRSAKDLLHTYLGGDFIEKSLSGGTSDHLSWHNQGYPVVFPFEDPANYNHKLHTADDTSQTINALPLSERFAKLALAFLSHQAGLVAAAEEEPAQRAALRAETPNDLRLAIELNSGKDLYNIAIAGSDEVKRIELCRSSSAGALTCEAARMQTTEDRLAGQRRLFYATAATALADQTPLSLFGYDAQDKLVAARTVRLVKK